MACACDNKGQTMIDWLSEERKEGEGMMNRKKERRMKDPFSSAT